jgi:predicted  nucleic acid-binding Zn-ribbon protein
LLNDHITTQVAEEKKLQANSKKLGEISTQLFQLTKNFLNCRREHGSDYKKVLDAEMKYKLAFMQYEDLKVKGIDLENAVKDSKVKIKDTQMEIDKKLKVLVKQSDYVFHQITETMTKFFTEIEHWGLKDSKANCLSIKIGSKIKPQEA